MTPEQIFAEFAAAVVVDRAEPWSTGLAGVITADGVDPVTGEPRFVLALGHIVLTAGEVAAYRAQLIGEQP